MKAKTGIDIIIIIIALLFCTHLGFSIYSTSLDIQIRKLSIEKFKKISR